MLSSTSRHLLRCGHNCETSLLVAKRFASVKIEEYHFEEKQIPPGRGRPKLSTILSRQRNTSRNNTASVSPHPASQPSTSTEVPPKLAIRPPRQSRIPRASLDPYQLTEQIQALCAQNRLEDAVELLQKAHKTAVNVVVYNTIIKEALQKEKNKLAWELWMEMKRAGIKPTPRSYTVFFSSIVPTSITSSFSHNINAVYEQWKMATKSGKIDTSSSNGDPASVVPTNAYLTLLSCLKEPDLTRMWAIYRDLPKTGPMTSDAQTVTVLLKAIVAAGGEDSEEQILGLFRAMENFRLSARDLSTLLSILRGYDKYNRKDTFRESVLSFISDSIGLVRSKKGDVPTKLATELPKRTALDGQALFDCMLLAMQYRRRRTAAAWFNQVKEKQLPGLQKKDILETRHCELFMAASPNEAEATLVNQIRSSSKATRPLLSTYTAAIQAGLTTDNYPSILRILAHMTGTNDTLLLPGEPRLLDSGESVSSSDITSAKRIQEGSQTKRYQPDQRVICILLQAGLESRDWRKLQRSLNAAKKFGFYDPEVGLTPVEDADIPSKPVLLPTGVTVKESDLRKYRQYWELKMRRALWDTYEKLQARQKTEA